MAVVFRFLKQAAKKVLPPSWWARLRRLLYPGRFYLHPYFLQYWPGPDSVLRWARYEAGYYLWRWTRGQGVRIERPIFMIGCVRSGTTKAVNLFGLHPDVANLSEAPEIWDPWHWRDPAAEHYWTAADVRSEDVARLHARFEYHRRFHGKARFVNKHPRNAFRLEYMRAVFPDAVFLHVIRDGRAVAASMVEFLRARPHLANQPMGFFHPPNWRTLVREDKAEQSALQWRAIVNTVVSKRAELGSAYYEFKYEDLCENTRAVLAAAWRFAGLRVDAEVLERLPERLENRNYKWKTQLRPEQIDMITRIQEPLLAQLGYRV